MSESDQQKIEALEAQLNRTTETLRSLISWMAQTAGSPISPNDARILLGALGTE